jgi:TonB family protein
MVRVCIHVNFVRFRTWIASTHSSWKFLLALFLAVTTVPSARPQEHPDVSPLASKVANYIEQISTKSIIVFDFTGPHAFVTPVGGKLADDLSDVLATSSRKFKVIDRVRAMQALESNRLAPEITADREVAGWIAQSIGADVAIVGRLLSLEGGNIQLSVDCLYAKEGKVLQSFQATFPLTDKWKSELGMNIDPDSVVGAVLGTRKDQGNSFAQCVSCPAPEFPRAARDQPIRETLILQVVVGTDGKARDIRVVKSPGNGLSIAAIQAIQKWRFKPARGASGARMETRTPIEVNFSQR